MYTSINETDVTFCSACWEWGTFKPVLRRNSLKVNTVMEVNSTTSLIHYMEMSCQLRV